VTDFVRCIDDRIPTPDGIPWWARSLFSRRPIEGENYSVLERREIGGVAYLSLREFDRRRFFPQAAFSELSFAPSLPPQLLIEDGAC
jgi:hypothetical protein